MAKSIPPYPVQMERLVTITKWVDVAGRLIGLQFTHPAWQFNRITLATCILAACGTICIFYTLIVCLSNIFMLLETLCCLGTLIPSVMKIVSSLRAPQRICSLWDFAVLVHRGNTEGRRSVVLHESAVATFNLIRTCCVVFVITATLFFAFPLYNTVVNREPTYIVNLYVPFVNPRTDRGFIITSLSQWLLSLLAAVGNIAYDIMLTMAVSNYQGFVSVFECQLQTLATLNRLDDSAANRRYRRDFLRNVFVQLLDIKEYENSVTDVYGNLIAVQVISYSSAIVLSLFAIMTNDWQSGYGYVVFAFVIIYTHCYLGTLLANQNERLIAMIYDVPWYGFDKHDKEVIKYMFVLSQSSNEIWIGTFAPLNVETASKITQNVYSYYTMMMSFLDNN